MGWESHSDSWVLAALVLSSHPASVLTACHTICSPKANPKQLANYGPNHPNLALARQFTWHQQLYLCSCSKHQLQKIQMSYFITSISTYMMHFLNEYLLILEIRLMLPPLRSELGRVKPFPPPFPSLLSSHFSGRTDLTAPFLEQLLSELPNGGYIFLCGLLK